MQGTVVVVHSGGLYRVQCDAGHEVLAQLSGRMRRFRIKVVPGDRVTVGVSPYDPCLLYTSDAADERSSVDLGGRRIIKKKKIMYFFFFKQKTAYEMLRSLVGSEMCIRDRYQGSPWGSRHRGRLALRS